MKVLMVCLGNICRSPLAQGILEHKAKAAGLDWLVESVGVYGGHAGKAPDFRSQHVALAHGLDISAQRGRKLRFADVDDFDLIYCMDTGNYGDVLSLCDTPQEKAKVKLIMDELEPGKGLPVPDPYYGGPEDFDRVYELLDKACDAIIRNHGKDKK